MKAFRIAAAQIASTRGDLAGNIERHANAILAAARHDISMVVFPELSLIGYELSRVESCGESIGISICADSSRSTHPASHAAQGATVYAASVFLNQEWHATDSPRFSRYARKFGMLVLMANHAASRGTLESVGNSAAWLPSGELLVGAPGTVESLVVATRSQGGWLGQLIDP